MVKTSRLEQEFNERTSNEKKYQFECLIIGF
jgi:hypothetical protein